MKTTTSTRYTSKFVNRNFRIKVYGLGKNTLVGVRGALELIGELLYKFVDRAINSGLDKCVCKLRRGLVITLYSK